MNTDQTAECLIFNHPNPEKVTAPAQFLTKELSKIDLKTISSFSVIAFHCELAEQAVLLLEKIEAAAPHCEKLVSLNKLTGKDLQNIFSSEAAHIQICNFSSEKFNTQIEQAQVRYQRRILNSQSVENKNNLLQNTSRAQKRTVTIKTQVEALHKALLAVHSAQSVSEVETLLYSALAKALELSWVRVFLHASEHLDTQLGRIQGQALFKATLTLNSRNIGRIVFARLHAKAFSKSEEESLNQIAESVALALDRLAKLDQAETLKFQWDSTFDAISEPLCLTDEKFNILRTNQAFLKTTGLKLTKAIGANCFSAFSGRSTSAQVEPSPTAFILQRATKSKNNVTSYEVTTQRISVGTGTESILLVMFRDITEQKKIEKQIFESSKMAELGTIGSSIAHDINNPLGGMLNFLQLIKMELKLDHPLYEDILEMERAGLRCKEIVENLLRFSRRQETVQAKIVKLREVIDHALKISELQTRSLGIEVEINCPENQYQVIGHFNLLSQALSHILQNAFDAVSDKLNRKPGYKGQIKIDVSAGADGTTLTINDNGIGISPELQSKILNPLFSTKTNKRNPGLGLTLAYQIINEHHGQLEISSQSNVGTKVKISFANV